MVLKEKFPKPRQYTLPPTITFTKHVHKQVNNSPAYIQYKNTAKLLIFETSRVSLAPTDVNLINW